MSHLQIGVQVAYTTRAHLPITYFGTNPLFSLEWSLYAPAPVSLHVGAYVVYLFVCLCVYTSMCVCLCVCTCALHIHYNALTCQSRISANILSWIALVRDFAGPACACLNRSRAAEQPIHIMMKVLKNPIPYSDYGEVLK